MNKWICLLMCFTLLALNGCGSLNQKSWKIYNDEFQSHQFFFDTENPFVIAPAVVSLVPCYLLAAPAVLAGYDYDHTGSLLMWGPTSPFILFLHEPFVSDREEVAAAEEEELMGGPPLYGDEWRKERDWQQDRDFDREGKERGY